RRDPLFRLGCPAARTGGARARGTPGGTATPLARRLPDEPGARDGCIPRAAGRALQRLQLVPRYPHGPALELAGIRIPRPAFQDELLLFPTDPDDAKAFALQLAVA